MQDAVDPPVEAFAYYLPQFYPIDINAVWWGEGFTEWTSVLNAHRGRRSPRGTLQSPGELGFYDLRDPSIRARQGDLARLAGLSALCVYHYYSAGDRLLPSVEDAILADGAPDFPFFLGWANHDWTLAWKGLPNELIAKQEYDELQSDTHIERILEAMGDRRYYQVDGRHLLFIYDPLHIPQHREVFKRWREVAARRGLELMLLGNASAIPGVDPSEHGLDAWVQGTSYIFGGMSPHRRAIRSLRSPSEAVRFARHRDIYWSYAELAEAFETTYDQFPLPTVPVVVSSWNNVGRRTRRASSAGVSPEGYEQALRSAIKRAPVLGTGEGRRRLIAINAWNEWGEGMTLEPSAELGNQLLDATRRAVHG